MFVYNKSQFKNLRRSLRKTSTPAERKIWSIIKNQQILGYRFLRQYGIKNFILDFYCPKLKLAIEIDGGQHNNEQERLSDNTRTNILEFYGIKVLRFWNNEIMENLDGVYERVVKEIKELNKPLPNPPLWKRGGTKD